MYSFLLLLFSIVYIDRIKAYSIAALMASMTVFSISLSTGNAGLSCPTKLGLTNNICALPERSMTVKCNGHRASIEGSALLTLFAYQPLQNGHAADTT
ncbi:MAG: hypothetical protein ABGX33_05795 [Cycloclasticus sp.]